MTTKAKSAFATSLRMLMDGCTRFSKQQWAEILRVSPSAISQWLGDQTLPRAPTLRSIVDIAREHGEAEALADFARMAMEPAEVVSPLGRRMMPTVSHYMVEPIRDSFLRLLGTLRPAGQEEVLLEASQHCHLLRDQRRSRAERPKGGKDVSPEESLPVLRHGVGASLSAPRLNPEIGERLQNLNAELMEQG